MEDLVFFYPQGHARHFQYGHPEQPERVEAVRRALEQAGWWGAYPQLEALDLPEEILLSVHTGGYLEELQLLCAEGASLDFDTYTTPASWQLALNAAGGAAAVAAAVWRREAGAGFALTRPPGHHATRQRGMGFCLLNNVALAAEYLVQRMGAKRLAIVDLDLHHGNGTQDIFWERGDVFYISTHQMPLYPGTGYVNEIGSGAGEGKTANIPMPPYAGDQAFTHAMQELILPLLDRFQAEMLLVSVGFDTHWRDPLGSLKLSAAVYGELIRELAAWAKVHAMGRIALVLEGGYDLEAMGACAQACTAALLEAPWEDPLGAYPRPEGTEWRRSLQQVKTFWRDSL